MDSTKHVVEIDGKNVSEHFNWWHAERVEHIRSGLSAVNYLHLTTKNGIGSLGRALQKEDEKEMRTPEYTVGDIVYHRADGARGVVVSDECQKVVRVKFYCEGLPVSVRFEELTADSMTAERIREEMS